MIFQFITTVDLLLRGHPDERPHFRCRNGSLTRGVALYFDQTVNVAKLN